MDRNSSTPTSAAINCLHFLLLFCIIFLIYANTFESPFTFDDQQIEKNYYIAIQELSFESLKQAASLSPNRWRWLPNISFGLNYYFGGLEVFGFHLVNISIHVLTAFFFYLLARLTLELVMAGRFARTTEIALAAAILWAVHPLQTNGVTYIVQRMTSLAALFSLCSLLCYARARLASTTLAKAVLFAGAILTGIMALFSKETSGMLPIMILGYEFFFLRRAHAIERKKLILLAAAATLVFILICVLFLGSDPVARVLAGYGSRDFTLGQRLLTQPRIISHYLSLFVLPLPARLNLAYDFQLSTGLLAPAQTLLAFMGLAGLTLLGFFLYRRARLASFAIFWFLGNLLVESSVIPLELIFEHRMYMPSMFLCLAAVAWFHRLGTGHLNRARIPLAAIAILFSLFTWQRNDVWKNEISIWTDVVNKTPNLARAYGNLGKAYGSEGRHNKAEELFRQAIRLDPQNGLSYISLGAALENQNRTSEALSVYDKALSDKTLIQKRSNQAQLHRNLARLHLKLNNPKAAIGHASQALQIDRLNYEVYTLLGAAYFKYHNYSAAEKILLTGIEHFPEKGALYRQLGVVYENQGRLQEAAAVLEKALNSKEVDLARTYNTLGIVYWRLQQFQQSVTAAKKAIASNPELVDAYLTLGITYEEMGQQNMAREQFRTAWQKGLDMVTLYNEWAGNFIRMNKTDKAISYLHEAVALEPDRLESFINLESAYRKKGMLHEAEKAKIRAEQIRLRQTAQ